MTVSIRVADANFTYFFDRTRTPIKTGLVGEYYFGGGEGATIKNWAGPTNLTAHGSITYNDNYVTFTSGANGFTTGIDETEQMTLIIVHKKPVAATASLFSNFGSGAGPELSTGIIQQSTTALTMRIDSADTDSSPQASVSQPGTAGVGITTGRTSSISGGYAGLIQYTSAALTHNNKIENEFARQFNSPYSMSIGYANGSTAYSGVLDVYAAAIYNTAVSDADILTIESYYRELYGF